MKDLLASIPSPIEILLDPVSLIVLGMYAVLIIWEAFFPAKKLPKIKYWKLKGLSAFTVFFYLSSYFPMFWDIHLVNYQIFDLITLGTFWGAFVSVTIYELGVYVWHRLMHHNNLLWRVFHQMHHSAERLDTYGAFYFSITDMIGFTFIGSLTLVLVAGFTPQATTLFILITTFFSIFQHSNIKTPRWIGYIIQRPESHALHHAKGVHKHNYSDLPIFDIIFGTFYNPKDFVKETGFYRGGSSKIVEMLTFKDISSKPTMADK